MVERRLLAGLFRWPTLVEPEPLHFASAHHGALFWALQDVQMTFPVDPLTEGWRVSRGYDDAQLALVVEFMRREGSLELFDHAGGVEHYIVEHLVEPVIMPSAIPALVELVRACPRCGR